MLVILMVKEEGMVGIWKGSPVLVFSGGEDVQGVQILFAVYVRISGVFLNHWGIS